MDEEEWCNKVFDTLLLGSITRMKNGKPGKILTPPDYCIRCGGDLPTIYHKDEPVLSEAGYICPKCMEEMNKNE